MWLVWVFLIMLFPAAYPISLALDRLLGQGVQSEKERERERNAHSHILSLFSFLSLSLLHCAHTLSFSLFLSLELGTIYTRTELKKLLDIHGSMTQSDLTHAETRVLAGVVRERERERTFSYFTLRRT